ncbi:cyclic nucleotide-binding domain (cNMP-BD) protein [Rhodopseudomonas palustris BisB18]|uniref:Cyclic nucleotide-binding domain (CNMP-BD) protein n=2 Tax=Rhodopseudomonas palustris TaxID=1076 RepID=Q211M0_RHOPB
MLTRSPNQFLASLPADDFAQLQPDLRPLRLVQDEVLFEAGETLTAVYFPHSGIISKVVHLSDGSTVEVALIGHDGVCGGAAVLNGGISPTTATVQFPGSASLIDSRRFIAAASRSETLRLALMKLQWIDFVQAEQLAACNASHDITARLCRRLLRLRDLALSNTLPLTQDLLARMLGVRRNSVSLVAGALQHAGIIRYSRGQVEITRVDGLAELACECYATNKSHADALNRRD